jgi:ergothioneine biosynthesis protein EgtB
LTKMSHLISNPDLKLLYKEKYSRIRKYSEKICEPLKTDDYGIQPAQDVSPPKWHLAHSTWFWEEFILSKYFPGYKRFHPRFAFLFNSYYDSVGERVLRPDRGNMSRPTVEDIYQYRKYVDEHMSPLLQKDIEDDLINLIGIGLNHEQQHQELLLTDIKYILGHNPLFPVYDKNFKETSASHDDDGFIEVQGGSFNIGFEGEGFSFDNEHALHKVILETFRIRKSLVTNGEFLEFMKDKGYQRYDLWLSDGWAWVNENKVKAPLYWHNVDRKWHRYSLAGLEVVNVDEPVTHISFYEAAAFAEWSGLRLPTEFEWEAASGLLNWGQRWEHTNSAYLPYPRYQKPSGPVGEYNGKFMVNQMVLRGASVATPAEHSRKTYRNFFSPALRWQFNGIRLCK